MGWQYKDDFPTDAEILAAFEDVVQETVEAVAQDASALAPVDTGALRDSFYGVGPDGSGYEAAKTKMHTTNARAAAADPLVLDDYGADGIILGGADSAASHAELIETGFTGPSGRHVAGRPSMGNALRGQRDAFDTRQAQALRKLGAKKVVK